MTAIALLLAAAVPADSVSAELRSIQRELEMRAWLHRLDPASAGRVREIVRRAHEIRHRVEPEARAIVERQLEAFCAFRAEDLRNVGFTPPCERAVADANNAEEQLLARLAEELNPLADEVAGLLHLRGPRGRDGAPPRSELERVRREIHPEPTLAARLLMSDEAARAVGFDCSDRHDAGLEALLASAGALREEINLINLANGLQLDADQIEALLPVLEELERAREEADRGCRAQREDALADARAALERARAGEAPDPRVLGRLRRLLQPHLPANAQERALASALSILTDAQKEVLRDYAPCVIPPRDLKDPVRAGQVPDRTPRLRILEQIRRIPDARWRRNREEVLDRILAGAEERGGSFPPEERAQVRERLAGFAERVRAMDDLTFQLQKESLAEEVSFLNRFETLKREFESARDPQALLVDKARVHLLHPRMLGVLRARLEQIRTFEPAPVDLDRGPVAESCDSCSGGGGR